MKKNFLILLCLFYIIGNIFYVDKFKTTNSHILSEKKNVAVKTHTFFNKGKKNVYFLKQIHRIEDKKNKSNKKTNTDNHIGEEIGVTVAVFFITFFSSCLIISFFCLARNFKMFRIPPTEEQLEDLKRPFQSVYGGITYLNPDAMPRWPNRFAKELAIVPSFFIAAGVAGGVFYMMHTNIIVNILNYLET